MPQQQLNAIEVSMQELDQIQRDTVALSNSAGKSFLDAYKYALVAQKVMSALTPDVMTTVLLPLRNKDFGWREDKPGQYNMQQLQDVFTSAILYGALPTNNEILVISGRFYPQKSFFTRKLAELPGLTDLVLQPGKVTLSLQGALVEYTANWKLDGKTMSMARTGSSAIPCKLQTGQGADAALGKAERKLKAAIYNQLTGSSFSEGEAEEVVVEGVESVSGVVVTDSREAVPAKLDEPPAQTRSQTQRVAQQVTKHAPAKTETQAQGSNPWEGGGAEPAKDAQATPTQTTAQTPAATKALPSSTVPATPVATRTPAPPSQPGPSPTAAASTVQATQQAAKSATATAAASTQALPPSPRFDASGTGEVDEAKFLVVGISGKKPPHRIKLEDGLEYWTKDTAKAEKAKELKTQGVPVLMTYVMEPCKVPGFGDFRIVIDVQPADFGEEGDQGSESGENFGE